MQLVQHRILSRQPDRQGHGGQGQIRLPCAGGETGIGAVGCCLRRKFMIGQSRVGLPVPLLCRIGPQAVDEIVGAAGVDALPDLRFRVPAGPVPPNEVTAPAQTAAGDGGLFFCSIVVEPGGVPALGMFAGIEAAIAAAAGENAFRSGVVECPLGAAFVPRITIGYVVAQNIIAEIFDAVIHRPIPDLAGGCTFPDAQLQIPVRLDGGGTAEIVVEGPHPVAPALEQSADPVDIEDKGVIDGAAAVLRGIGLPGGVLRLHLVAADAHFRTAQLGKEGGIGFDESQGEIAGRLVGYVDDATVVRSTQL